MNIINIGLKFIFILFNRPILFTCKQLEAEYKNITHYLLTFILYSFSNNNIIVF